MNITLSPEVALKLETITNYAGRHEFSGFGWAKKEKDRLYIYDILLLHVGSEGLTTIPAETVKDLIGHENAEEMRVWFHRHPLGNRTPGWHNWSGTDNATIADAPLGGIPQIVKWSASIVRTPAGWVGRIDNHIAGKTVHVEVLGQAPYGLVQETVRLLDAYYKEIAVNEQRRQEASRGRKFRATEEDLQWLADQYGIDPGEIFVDEEGFVELYDEWEEDDEDPAWLHKDILEMTEEEYADFEASLANPQFLEVSHD